MSVEGREYDFLVALARGPETDERERSDPRTVVYNGVGVSAVGPEEQRDYWPAFKDGTSMALRRRVRRGDDVVVVGRGKGITTVVAARMTHFEGTVRTYEATSEMLATLRHTLDVNRVTDLVTLEHAAVGPVSDRSEEMFGPVDGEQLPPAPLPECDVLELDPEGSELAVFREMESDHESLPWGRMTHAVFPRRLFTIYWKKWDTVSQTA